MTSASAAPAATNKNGETPEPTGPRAVGAEAGAMSLIGRTHPGEPTACSVVAVAVDEVLFVTATSAAASADRSPHSAKRLSGEPSRENATKGSTCAELTAVAAVSADAATGERIIDAATAAPASLFENAVRTMIKLRLQNPSYRDPWHTGILHKRRKALAGSNE